MTPQKRVFRNLTLSKYTLILVLTIVVILNAFYRHWNNPYRIITEDVLQYYGYLPATFVHHDISMNFVKSDPNYWSQYFWPVSLPNGKYTFFTTMGMSIMYSPFFLITHYPLKWLGGEATGFSPPYKIALIFSCLVYFALGLMVLRKILLRFFSEGITSLTIVVLVLATNLLYYVSDEPTMSHAYNFVLITFFLYLSILWNDKPDLKHSVALGLIAGLIALIRPTNIVIVLIFIFWGVENRADFVQRLQLMIRKYDLILVIIVMTILVWVPQMIYWKYITGHFLFFSYGEKGKFFFSNPQIINVLFSYRKGWLLYTPVMMLALAGMIFLWKFHRKLFWPVMIYFVVNLYVISSWWLWWYGGSYGHRAFIGSYGILALPLAASMEWMFRKRHLVIRILSALVIVIFITHNVFQILQYHTGALHYVSMTREAYWDSFGRLKPSPRFKFLLVFPDYKSAADGIYPKPEPDPMYTGKLSEEECISRIIDEIKSSPDALEAIEKKAAQKSITVDSMLRLDAEYIYKYKVENGIIPKSK